MSGARPQRVAVYTRKSTEEGLEQEFNSLACPARGLRGLYRSASGGRGWKLAAGRAMTMAASRAAPWSALPCSGCWPISARSRIDVVVVYKVDRLTRSLTDFARIVEHLRCAWGLVRLGHPAFNTTTSMGRLTLNVLLSFAQFEREVTGERIRDKIAASKRKGMWMGGVVPLGYDVRDRKLVVNEPEAERSGRSFASYRELGSVRCCAERQNGRACCQSGGATRAAGTSVARRSPAATSTRCCRTRSTSARSATRTASMTGEHAAIIDAGHL